MCLFWLNLLSPDMPCLTPLLTGMLSKTSAGSGPERPAPHGLIPDTPGCVQGLSQGAFTSSHSPYWSPSPVYPRP